MMRTSALLLALCAACGGKSRALHETPVRPVQPPMNAGGMGAVPATPGDCSDYIPPVNQAIRCRDTDECASDEVCWPPGKDLPLDCHGDCLVPLRECDTAADCGNNYLCIEGYWPCACAGAPPHTTCERPCLPNTCGLNFRCNSQSGVCEYWPCTEGYVCFPTDVCDPDNVEADENGCRPERCEEGFECPFNTRCSATEPGHGCATLPCQADAECDCGACVNETCVSGLGTCATL